MYMCARGIYLSSTIFRSEFGTVLLVQYFLLSFYFPESGLTTLTDTATKTTLTDTATKTTLTDTATPVTIDNDASTPQTTNVKNSKPGI